MRRYSNPALRGALAGVLAIAILLLLDFAPLHLVAYGQTAGPLPVVTPPPDIFPPPILTAIAGDTPGNCNVLTGPVTAAGGGGASAQCSGGGVLSIDAPIGAVGGDGTLAVVTVGAVLGESNDCTGANQLPILATQHFMSVWNRPGQPASINLNLRPVSTCQSRRAFWRRQAAIRLVCSSCTPCPTVPSPRYSPPLPATGLPPASSPASSATSMQSPYRQDFRQHIAAESGR